MHGTDDGRRPDRRRVLLAVRVDPALRQAVHDEAARLGIGVGDFVQRAITSALSQGTITTPGLSDHESLAPPELRGAS